MNTAKILIYDGSFNGFLTAVFTAFQERLTLSDIRRKARGQNDLFSETHTIFTQMDKAKRVWKGMERKNHSALRNSYFAFLSETKNVEMLVYNYICKMFGRRNAVDEYHPDMVTQKIGQLARMVEREKQYLEASIDFQLSGDGIYFAAVRPDFNVLPLISKHFRSRFGDQPWMIYDLKRNYGLFQDGGESKIVSLDSTKMELETAPNGHSLNIREHISPDLWPIHSGKTDVRTKANGKFNRQRARWRYRGEKEAV
ncbi:TIGR03915 family putative DNA repair protein [Poritiphilus flavus]|uniref:DUF4130 domain-containing protein n=1 Tax=Poritiphilus flavus TaxID=2697053 RepID=A0A6L9EEY2_9FLAO|nr:TIGR03915 family putative DNA repair protein [Poritiphilus flavus]NAS13132.1 DUF4130 domain-containing protein [Poritiphilus flavus]